VGTDEAKGPAIELRYLLKLCQNCVKWSGSSNQRIIVAAVGLAGPPFLACSLIVLVFDYYFELCYLRETTSTYIYDEPTHWKIHLPPSPSISSHYYPHPTPRLSFTQDSKTEW
jgi:hypothetical protein